MKFKVQLVEARKIGVTEEASAETYKLKRAVQLQIPDKNDFKRQVYLLF